MDIDQTTPSTESTASFAVMGLSAALRAGRRERFVAPTRRRYLGTPVPTGPAAPADRLLGLRHSG